MMKQFVSSATLALGFALPATALAQGGSGDCPPGSWFCAQDSQQQATPAGKPVGGLAPLPDPDPSATPPAHGTIIYQAGSPPPEGAPPVVVYQPPPPVVVVRPEEAPPPPPDYEYAPPSRPHIRHSEWGLNGHVEGAAFGHGTGGDAGMGGAGIGLRFKPNPHFGIESDVDFVGGHDWQGDSRTEAALAFNGLLFLNPRSRVQIYLIAGFGWTAAHVTNDSSLDAHYNYFGGQGGAGLEIRLSRNFALNGDIRGFIRGRTDRLADSQPEFTSADGRTTNTSGGALFTGGLTLYF